jgi:hypothetical protein
LLLSSAVPALPASAAAAGQSTVGSRECQQTPARQTRRSIIGGIAGGLIGRAVGSNRVTSTLGSWIPAQTMLTDALLNLLDCDEQQKAAQATEQVTTQAEAGGAGTTVAWRSESRPGVSGRSTVTSVDNAGQGGRRCMTVTDVVIVDGEETTMPKRMCRQPPSTRYARV